MRLWKAQSGWFPSPALLLPPMLAGLMLGCADGDDGLPRREISGSVTFDGKPLASGSIQFQPEGVAQEATVSAGGLIADGRYRVGRKEGLVPGSYKVLIFSHGEGPGSAGDLPEPGERIGAPPERIPPRYNAATTLVAEVAKDGANVFDFDLKK